MDYLEEYGLIGAFDSVCLCLGDDDAVVIEESGGGSSETLTYLDLQALSSDVALQLMHRHKVVNQDKVLFITDDGRQQAAAEIVALLACLRIGSVFVPVNANASANDLQYICESTNPIAAIVVANSDDDATVRKLATLGSVFRVVLLHANGSLTPLEANACDIRDDLPAAHPSATECACAYVLYTSGSTGVPKGVRGTVLGLISRLQWQHSQFPLQPHECCLRRTPLTFVDAFAEIIFPLLSGCPLYVPDRGVFKNLGLAGIASKLEEAGVTRVTLLPSQLSQALSVSSLSYEVWPSLEYCHVSGEACPAVLISQFHARFPTVTLLNLYGSTELAGDVTYAVLSPPEHPQFLPLDPEDGGVPIGRCMPGNTALLLTATATAAADGASSSFNKSEVSGGELFIFGTHVADGYQNLPEETASRFLTNIRVDGVMIAGPVFRTGDIVTTCKNERDVYLYKGRRDNQTKINGVRVELEGVEATLLTALGASSGLAVLIAEEGQLVLVVERSLGDSALVLQRVRNLSPHVRHVPSLSLAFGVDRLPRNLTGKIDRNQLKSFLLLDDLLPTQPTAAAVQRVSSKHDSVHEAKFRAILASVLPHCATAIMTDVNFDTETFASLGGDSVRFIELCWKIRTYLQISNFHWTKNLWEKPLRSLLDEIEQIRGQASLNVLSGPLPNKKAKREVWVAQTHGTTGPEGAAALIGWYGRGGTSGGSSTTTQPSTYQVNGIPSLPLSLSLSWSHLLSKCIDASPLIVIESSGDHGGNPASFCYVGDHSGLFVKIACDRGGGEAVWRVQLVRRRVAEGKRVDKLHIEGQAAVVIDGYGYVFVCSFSGNSRDDFTEGDVEDDESLLTHMHTHSDVDDDSQGGSQGVVWALHAASGQRVWSKCLPGEVKSTPLVIPDKGFLCVSTYSGIHIIAIADGAHIQHLCHNMTFFSSPTLSVTETTQIYCASTSGSVVCIRFDDAQNRFELAYCEDASGGPIFASLAFSRSENSLIFGAVDGVLRCLSVQEIPKQLSLRWMHQATRPIFSSALPVLLLSGLSCYAFGCHDNWLRCVNSLDGSLIWETDCYSVIFATPAALNDDFIVAATTGGEVHLLSAQNGKIISSVRLPAEIYSSPVCVGGAIFVGCRDDRLWKIRTG